MLKKIASAVIPRMKLIERVALFTLLGWWYFGDQVQFAANGLLGLVLITLSLTYYLAAVIPLQANYNNGLEMFLVKLFHISASTLTIGAYLTCIHNKSATICSIPSGILLMSILFLSIKPLRAKSETINIQFVTKAFVFFLISLILVGVNTAA